MENKQKFIKVKYNDTKKIISHTNSFEDFLKKLQQTFKLNIIPLDLSNYSLSYIDDEDDNIFIENSLDFSEALKFEEENSSQNYLTLIIHNKNSNTFIKDQKDNFEFIESFSNKSQDFKSSLQIDLLIPRGEKTNFNKIQKLDDIKFFMDENEKFNFKNLRNQRNYKKEEIILGTSPEISLDLPREILLKKNNFEITYTYENENENENKNKKSISKKIKDYSYSSSNQIINKVNELNIQKIKKNRIKKEGKNLNTVNNLINPNINNINNNTEFNNSENNNNNNNNTIKKNIEEISEKKNTTNKIIKNKNKEKKYLNSEKEETIGIKKITNQLMKKAFSKEINEIKQEISSELNEIIKKHYKDLNQKNEETSKKLENAYSNYSNLLINYGRGLLPKNLHLGFTCNICKQNPILGIRYKCSVCKDFDICEKCEENNIHQHPFLKIRSAEVNPNFIKTITFDSSSNYAESDYNNNSEYENFNGNLNNINPDKNNNNEYVEKFIDLDIEKNMDILNYFNKHIKEKLNKGQQNKKGKENNKKLNQGNKSLKDQKELKDINDLKNFKEKEKEKKQEKKSQINSKEEKNSQINFNKIINLSENNNNIYQQINLTNKINDNNDNNNNNNNNNYIFNLNEIKIICLNSNEIFKVKNSNSKVFKILLKFKNIGKINLPQFFNLNCISNENDLNEITGKKTQINYLIKPEMNFSIEISINILDKNPGIYLSKWKMETLKKEIFSEEFSFKIFIEKTEEISINKNFILNQNQRKNSFELFKNFEEKRPRIISLEEFRKLKKIKQMKIEENFNNNNITNKVIDFYLIADDIIKRNSDILIPKKELVNALFRTNGHEKNSILMAVNKEINVCTTHKKELYN
jgi:hypothetical protein